MDKDVPDTPADQSKKYTSTYQGFQLYFIYYYIFSLLLKCNQAFSLVAGNFETHKQTSELNSG